MNEVHGNIFKKNLIHDFQDEFRWKLKFWILSTDLSRYLN